MEELKTYYLLDTDLTIVDLIETYESMIWTLRYWEPGDFELYLPATEKTMNMFTEAAKKNYYILRDDDGLPSNMKSLMVIEKVTSETDVEGGNHLSITGKCVKSILSKRIIANNYILAGNVEEEIYRIVDENAIHTGDQARLIPYLDLGPTVNERDSSKSITDIVNYNAEGLTLESAISSVTKLYKLGWDIVFDMDTKRLKFMLLKGNDLSYSLTADNVIRHPYVLFSDDFENLLTTKYVVDNSSYKNVAYVKGEIREYDNEKKDYVTTDLTQQAIPDNIGTAPIGLDRREMFVNGSTSSSNAQDYPNLYRTALLEKGKQELDKYKSTTDITGKIIPNYTFQVNVDYFIGDLVTVQNSYGQSFDARVTEIIDTEEVNGIKSIPSFVVENFIGKEQDEDITIDPTKIRYTENVSGHEIRITEAGGIRKLDYGHIDEELYCYVMSGGVRTRLVRTTENGLTRKTVTINKPKRN